MSRRLPSPPRLLRAFVFALLTSLSAAAQIPKVPAATASPEFARYRRAIVTVVKAVTNGASTGTACTVLDPAVYTHAAPGLRDLRLYPAGIPAGARDLPYALTLSEPQQPESAEATVLNLGWAPPSESGAIVFDLQMPSRPYTDVILDLKGQDFLATATVTGTDTAGAVGARPGTNLGDFTVFDLTSQHLSRSSTLHLGESSFPFLHIRLAVSPVPGAPESFRATPAMVLGANVPPSREGQTVFTVVLSTGDIEQRGRESIAHFHLPPRVPIERVRFGLQPQFSGNFSRDVRVLAKSTSGQPQSEVSDETTLGTIERVHLTEAGRDLRTEQLSLPATLGANLEGPADVDVTVDNGNDPPLPIAEVELEMRERKLCFDASSAPSSAELFYGDPALAAPQYDYARLFSATAQPVAASLGPEQPNPAFHDRPDTRALTEKHPGLLWVALLLVIGLLGFLALRSPKTL